MGRSCGWCVLAPSSLFFCRPLQGYLLAEVPKKNKGDGFASVSSPSASWFFWHSHLWCLEEETSECNINCLVPANVSSPVTPKGTFSSTYWLFRMPSEMSYSTEYSSFCPSLWTANHLIFSPLLFVFFVFFFLSYLDYFTLFQEHWGQKGPLKIIWSNSSCTSSIC